MQNPSKRAVRFFNTTGPCNPYDHYMLPPADRLVGAQLDRYIRDKLYWVLHAPRQTGKTTFLQSWMREINSGDEAVACYVSVEDCQGVTGRAEAMRTMYKAICRFAQSTGLPVPVIEDNSTEGMLAAVLTKWAGLVAPKPLIVLFDEVDVLEGEALISFLRQLRGGFAARRPGIFPVSIALVGMRDLKDYITAAKGGSSPNPGSPFNIKEDSAMLANFQKNDIAKLFAQRTAETGQQITGEALDYVYGQSGGQPWIVNSLFKRATMRILNEESRETVTADHLLQAREQMIEARETHLDALGVRLRDPKIKAVIETIFTGANDPSLGRTNPDVELSMDLGLITWKSETGFTIANPIYEEILTRYLNSGYHDNLPPPSSWQWQKQDGSLDMDALLGEFQRFWRKHSAIWEQKADYTEAFPHLLLTAFLQRVLNGGGRIERESAAGRGRMDLAVEYRKAWYIIEIKLIHPWDTPEEVRQEGLEQICRYRDTVDPAAPAYLVVFDRRPETRQKPWEERIGWDTEDTVRVVRC
ncbi:MAG: PD-(D/E)XK nuclease domain-containing protein [Treponema sp.]|nr:PD-(D/E)XK nuclease domain-containing protein [Treponema sp.]